MLPKLFGTTEQGVCRFPHAHGMLPRPGLTPVWLLTR
jgi:hypothetical protein